MMQQVPTIHTQGNVPQPKMMVDAGSKQDVIPRMIIPNQGWKASIQDNFHILDESSGQMFPPALVSGFDMINFLRYWRDVCKRRTEAELKLFSKGWSPETDQTEAELELERTNLQTREKWTLPPPNETPAYPSSNKDLVLHNMHDVVRDAKAIAMNLDKTVVFTHLALDPGHISDFDEDFITNTWASLPKPEMVGLMSKDVIAQSGSAAIDESVEALALFSRIQLMDDRRHTLRKKVMGLYGKRHWWSRAQWGHTERQIDVFAIEGLAGAPGMSDQMARVLLAKVQEYAHEEQMIVMVPWWAFSWSDGTDLTEYYVSLGFEKVDMNKGWYELVLTDISLTAEEMVVESQQIMTGMSLWAGEDGPEQVPYAGRY